MLIAGATLAGHALLVRELRRSVEDAIRAALTTTTARLEAVETKTRDLPDWRGDVERDRRDHDRRLTVVETRIDMRNR